MTELTFNELPKAIYQLCQDMAFIKQHLLTLKSEPQQKTDAWFDLTELESYLPEKLARPTLYGKLSKGEFPGHKKGKKWYFLKSEIDNYLKTGRKKTLVEMQAEADSFLQTKIKRS